MCAKCGACECGEVVCVCANECVCVCVCMCIAVGRADGWALTETTGVERVAFGQKGGGRIGEPGVGQESRPTGKPGGERCGGGRTGKWLLDVGCRNGEGGARRDAEVAVGVRREGGGGRRRAGADREEELTVLHVFVELDEADLSIAAS